MKISQNCNEVSCLASLLVGVGLLVSSTALALSTQGTLSVAARQIKDPALPAKTETAGLTRNPVFVHNTTAKVEPGPKTTTTTTSGQKSEDKKAISRCWMRLMTMVREVNHARRKSDK